MNTNMNEATKTPDYYGTTLTPLDVIHAWNLPFELANVAKYICRANIYNLTKHHDVQGLCGDIDKAIHYLQCYKARLDVVNLETSEG